MVYSCLIVDDEPIAIRVIKNHLANFSNIEVKGECNNAIEAMEFLSQTPVDLAFLDIQMPQITGIEFLRNLSSPPKIIFVTAYRDYAIDAFDLEVIDYLLKPVSLVRFTKAISRFYNRMHEQPEAIHLPAKEKTQDYIFLKAEKKLHKVMFDEIICTESMGDYLIVHTETGKIVTKQRISQIEEALPADQFVRVHRGFIVSIPKIKTILPGLLEVGSKKIPVGRNYKSSVEKLVKTNQQ